PPLRQRHRPYTVGRSPDAPADAPRGDPPGLRRPQPPTTTRSCCRFFFQAEDGIRDQAGDAVTQATGSETGELTAVEEYQQQPIIDRPIQAVGRRKEAVVRVRLVPGTGQFNLDGRTLEDYFPNKVHQQVIKVPLVTVDRLEQFDIYAHLDGGCPSGQAGALRLAIARALTIAQPEDRPALKKAGFLTRDPREIERKKYGLKKARKAPQYSKR